jgi:DNA replication regulator DPB11
MYEDPGQRDERKRLMSLFETQTQGGGDGRGVGKKSGRKGPPAVRRSTRVAGF